MTEQEIIERGIKAKTILDSPTMQEAIADCKLAIYSSWREAQNPITREELWYALEGLDRVVTWLEVALEGKDLAEILREEGKNGGT